MPPKVNAEQYADKLAARLKASIQDVQRGVERVTESPTEAAAQAQDKMIARLTEAVQGGKWAAGLRRVSLQEWKSKTITKGIPRIATGIDQARPKVVNFAQQLLAYEGDLMGRVENMPDLTLEDSINRATTWIRGMAQFKRQG